jgi:hydroxymethylpyrimidine/phosphomethylpyrimidine kinase
MDPSGGAGILADIKTFEALGAHGLGVCTALTFQNHAEWNGITWMDRDTIQNQVNSIIPMYPIKAVKIGIIQNLEVLNEVLSRTRESEPDMQVVWDPVLSSTTGFHFHKRLDWEKLYDICAAVDVITPNVEEITVLGGHAPWEESAAAFSRVCAVLVTGHSQGDGKVCDILVKDGHRREFTRPGIPAGGKHGSGCVLSSALAAFLAQGHDLEGACEKAGAYVHRFLKSSESMLGYHYANR